MNEGMDMDNRPVSIGGLVAVVVFVLGGIALIAGFAFSNPRNGQPREVTAVERASKGSVDITDLSVERSMLTVFLLPNAQVPNEAVAGFAKAFQNMLVKNYTGQDGIVIVFIELVNGEAQILGTNVCSGPEAMRLGIDKVQCLPLDVAGTPIAATHLRWLNK